MEEHSRPPCLGFGWRGHQLTPDSMDLPLHLELPGFRIQVIPLEGADHTPAQAGGQLGEKVPPHLVLLNGLQKGCPADPHSESALGGNWALELLCPVEFSAMLRILRRVNGVADTGTAAAAGGEDVHIV